MSGEGIRAAAPLELCEDFVFLHLGIKTDFWLNARKMRGVFFDR
jgi:hypothetical protein